MGDDATVFLLRSAKEARNIHEGHERNVERIAETYETCSLA